MSTRVLVTEPASVVPETPADVAVRVYTDAWSVRDFAGPFGVDVLADMLEKAGLVDSGSSRTPAVPTWSIVYDLWSRGVRPDVAKPILLGTSRWSLRSAQRWRPHLS